MQPRVPEGSESADAPPPPQGAVEAAEEGGDGGGGEEKGVCLPRADLSPPRPLPCPWRPRRHQEALPEKAQQPEALGL